MKKAGRCFCGGRFDGDQRSAFSSQQSAVSVQHIADVIVILSEAKDPMTGSGILRSLRSLRIT